MQKKEFLIIPNTKELNLYTDYNFNTFILPLEDYSIGFDIKYNIDEINNISQKYNTYVIMNKMLHMSIYDFKELYPKFNKNIKFIVEDIGLVNIIDKDRLILFENHILSNYKAINYLNNLGINSSVINNDLTIQEIDEITNKCNTNMYYFYVCKNTLMYSRRNLVSNFNNYFNIKTNNNSYKIKEKFSKKELEVIEEKYGSVIKNDKIFCASKYLEHFDKINLIVDLSSIDPISTKIILADISNPKLCDLIDSDYYFLEHPIKYKVGDLK